MAAGIPPVSAIPRPIRRGSASSTIGRKAAPSREAGGIRYAPVAGNAAFFQKYHDRTLVINGVDAQTNSHAVGILHNWSGRNAEGFPSMTALLAAQHSPDKPLAYLNFGGFAATQGVTRFTRLSDADRIQALAYTNHMDNEEILRPDEWSSLQEYRARRIARLNEAPGLLPRQARNRRHYASALSAAATEGLKRYADALPGDDQLERDVQYAYDGDNFWNGLRRQSQLTVLAFRTGVAVSADLYLGGFDTHRSNDAKQQWLLRALTESVDYLWEYAEIHGVADRLVVVMGSDFGRTNHYNAEDGKDHWPIGSFVVMEKNQSWTNRAVGETGRAALRPEGKPCDPAPRRRRRHDHLPETRPPGSAPTPRPREHASRRTVPLHEYRGLPLLRVGNGSRSRFHFPWRWAPISVHSCLAGREGRGK